MEFTRELNLMLIAPRWADTEDRHFEELERAERILELQGFGQYQWMILSRLHGEREIPDITDTELLINGLGQMLTNCNLLVGIGRFQVATDTLPYVATARAVGMPICRLDLETGQLKLIANSETEVQAAQALSVPPTTAGEEEQLRLEDELGVIEITFKEDGE